MDITEHRRISLIMLDLIALIVDNKDASDIVLEASDFDALYKIATYNGLGAITAFALKKAGYRNEYFDIIYAKAQRKNILFDREYHFLCEKLDEAEIRYLPLKGILLKQIYPSPCLREMTDIDIFFDSSPEKVKSVMLQSGYSCDQYDKTNHDVYRKASLFCVEMHRSLVDESLFPTLYQYFEKLTYAPAGNSSFRMQMTNEQMYIHLISHAYIHDTLAGTGLRTLLDIYLYLQAYSDRMDMDNIRRELELAGLSEYEMSLRSLSEKLLRYDTMSSEEKELLDCYIFAGKYGNQTRFIQNRIKRIMSSSDKPSKLAYIRKRISYNQKNIEISPFYSKHPELAPLLYITRPFNALFTRPKSVLLELKEIKKANK